MSRIPAALALALAAALLLAPASARAQDPGPAWPHGETRQPLDCGACHTPEAWVPARRDMDFDHRRATGFPLDGRHADVACGACHTALRFDRPRAAPDDCAACHVDVHQGRQPGACADCHDTRGFTGAAGPEAHAVTRFPLGGAHALIPCEGCHVDDRDGAFGPLPTDCVECHAGDRDRAVFPDHRVAGFPADCRSCHDDRSWTGAVFDHEAASGGFPLEGPHALLVCEVCHRPPDGRVPDPPAGPDDCVACHRADYEREHGAAGYPTACLLCHAPDTWDGAAFEHASAAGGYPLVGAHAAVACSGCHVPGTTQPLFTPSGPDDCVACHRADYDREHAGSGFPTSCGDCHGQEDWGDATFDHGTTTGYPLVGAHETLPCSACHVPPDNHLIFTPADQDDCVACHRADYDREHAGTGYPTECLVCHGPDTWEREPFDHAGATGYALVGAHEALPCTACHVAPGTELIFAPTGPDDCVACHRADYDREHAGTGYPTLCTLCHTADAWEGAAFDHVVSGNGYPLRGSHATLACTACHVAPGTELVFTPAGPDDCVACHRADYDRQHAGSGYPTVCAGCHNEEDWADTHFDHAVVSGGFALVGAHQALPCTACHVPPDNHLIFTPADQDDCVACHRADYDREHAGTGYPTECLVCHGPDTWEREPFDHAGATGYALVGAHEALPCTACHVAPGTELIFAPTGPDDCIACHRGDYDREHAGTGYPTECLVCHGTDTWSGAEFDHAGVSGYTLVGVHAGLPCTACHVPPDNELIFTPGSEDDCVACHRADYDRAHGGSGYPTTCGTCHPQTTWEDGRFNHDAQYFPIYTGEHRGEWNSCADCHPDPNDFSVFTCLTCHTRAATDPEHRGVPGYRYESEACLACHPRGDS